MALTLASSFAISKFTKIPTRSHSTHKSSTSSYVLNPAKCITGPNITCSQSIVRRSANYKPTIWDFEFIQSLNSQFMGEMYTKRNIKLKEEVRMMFKQVMMMKPLDQLELIDTLERLGLGYHFEDEIKTTLMIIFNDDKWIKEDLYAVALQFRLFRQHGFLAPQEVFNNFKDNQGNFKASLVENVEGMLSLYEASYLICEENESNLEDARIFSTNHLNNYVQQNNKDDDYVSMLIKHALELPLHWRMPRLESRWFIDVYERKQDMNPLLLELAKLNFNCVQAVHQQDLKLSSWWWKNTGVGEKLTFARNRLVRSFLWGLGIQFEPDYGYGRRMGTTILCLATVIDDIYDIYGTLDELELFTAAIERWDVNEIEHLPNYMKIVFLSLYNFVNEKGLDFIRKKEFNVIPHLKKSWAELCKFYLMEAKWYNSGYKPTLQEYLDKAWISAIGPLLLLHYYFCAANLVSNEELQYFHKYPHIIREPSMILRLADDLGTSPDEMKRGDNPKAIQCYMHENGASEEEAREYVKSLIRKSWMKINKDRVTSCPFSQTFINLAINLARISVCMYQYGDGHGVEHPKTKTGDRIRSLLVQPIPL